jgi:hypothetical protein
MCRPPISQNTQERTRATTVQIRLAMDSLEKARRSGPEHTSRRRVDIEPTIQGRPLFAGVFNGGIEVTAKLRTPHIVGDIPSVDVDREARSAGREGRGNRGDPVFEARHRDYDISKPVNIR